MNKYGVLNTTISLSLLCIIVSELITAVIWHFAGLPNLGFVLFVAFLCPAIIAPIVISSLCRLTGKLKNSEKKYRHSLGLMHYIISHARSAIAVHDRNLNYIYVSDRYLQEYNIKEENIIGKHHYEIFPDLPQKWRDVHQKALAGEVSSSEEDSYEREDGSIDWTRWECRPWHEVDGSIGGFIIYTEVITERKQAEMELLKSKEEWVKTFDAIQDIITIQDKDMRIVKANKAAHDILQIEPGELVGKFCYEVFRGTSQPCQHCPELETFKDIQHHEANITHENLGKIFHVTSSPIFDERDEFTHIIHIAKDITEHKKMERELFQAHKMEAIGTLAGGIAHDFNNILAPIYGYVELAMIKASQYPEISKDLEEVRKAAERAKEMVQQILTFSKQDSGELSPTQVHLIINEALNLLRGSIPATIEIRHGIDQNCGNVLANPTKIHQVLLNLCTNAYHAMRDTGGILGVSLAPIELSVKDYVNKFNLKPGKYLHLEVSDTGHGIDRKTQERIFEPYFTTKTEGEGTGMGLSVTHGIVKGLGGSITVYSEPGEGTSFHVYLPVIESSISQMEISSEEPVPHGTERIMVIDDEEIIRNMETDLLVGLGYNVESFANPLDALECFIKQPDKFDLLITDMTMPGMTGDKLAQKIMAVRPNMLMILCTGFSDLINEKIAKAKGFNEYITKPFFLDSFGRKVRNVLDTGRK